MRSDLLKFSFFPSVTLKPNKTKWKHRNVLNIEKSFILSFTSFSDQFIFYLLNCSHEQKLWPNIFRQQKFSNQSWRWTLFDPWWYRISFVVHKQEQWRIGAQAEEPRWRPWCNPSNCSKTHHNLCQELFSLLYDSGEEIKQVAHWGKREDQPGMNPGDLVNHNRTMSRNTTPVKISWELTGTSESVRK